MRRRDWVPTAPSVKYDKGSFSFLIALGRQLELALELEKDGSAPDFVIDSLGVLQNGLEGITGAPLDGEEPAGGMDEGGDDDDDSSSGLLDPLEDGSPRRRGGSRALGGAVPGGNNESGSPLYAVRRVTAKQPQSRTAKPSRKARSNGAKRKTKK